MSGEGELVNNAAWLSGYEARRRGELCPWGDDSARQGWICADREVAS